jgi:cell division septation protein DedD
MVRNYLVAAALLLAFSAPVSAQSVKAGIEAWQRADYSSAVAIWRPLAEKGDADAAFNLGQAYRLGRGVPTNLSIAKSWFERAARQNHVDAQTTLGLLLFQNGDQAEGLKWLKAAAEQGEARALLVYGTALFNGDGVTQDQVLGYAFVSRAAAQGLGPAKETLAQLDTLMPLDQRKKGVAIARTKAKAAPPPPVAKPAKPVQVASAKPAPAATPAPPKAGPVVQKPAKPSEQPKPQKVTVTAGGWTIQLGAFSKRSSAEALYQQLASKGAVRGKPPHYVTVGGITKLRVGSFASRSQAASACASLKGQPCFPFAER